MAKLLASSSFIVQESLLSTNLTSSERCNMNWTKWLPINWILLGSAHPRHVKLIQLITTYHNLIAPGLIQPLERLRISAFLWMRCHDLSSSAVHCVLLERLRTYTVHLRHLASQSVHSGLWLCHESWQNDKTCATNVKSLSLLQISSHSRVLSQERVHETFFWSHNGRCVETWNDMNKFVEVVWYWTDCLL